MHKVIEANKKSSVKKEEKKDNSKTYSMYNSKISVSNLSSFVLPLLLFAMCFELLFERWSSSSQEGLHEGNTFLFLQADKKGNKITVELAENKDSTRNIRSK
jgi:hypothetical protein